ncbi:hypothetical protein T01_7397 [Trichinella spiralis]|uniref:Uncharacterized protein n=1 Tax=Trichinella spiralis TaxID=6334 RepID=A0A0V1AT04_TRISP|nr:hypothetical protein T01_7397 [Trichinella spiralis]
MFKFTIAFTIQTVLEAIVKLKFQKELFISQFFYWSKSFANVEPDYQLSTLFIPIAFAYSLKERH